jgi:hypothetical protein
MKELTANNINARIEEILRDTVTIALCTNAHRNTSFDPEKRGEQAQAHFKEIILNGFGEASKLFNEDNKEQGIKLFNEFIEGVTKRYASLMSSKANCFSVMITGGGNFDNRRHEKANNAERKKSDDLYSYIEWKIGKIKKALAPAPLSTKEQLEEAKESHRVWLELNKLMRKKLSREEMLKEASEITKDINVINDFIWNLDNNSKFYTVNSNQRVKRLEKKLAHEEKLANTENKTQNFDGFKLIFNFEIERYQIIFDEIPNDEIRAKLKSLGFKWSGKNKAWQTYITDNGLRKCIAFRDYFISTNEIDELKELMNKSDVVLWEHTV